MSRNLLIYSNPAAAFPVAKRIEPTDAFGSGYNPDETSFSDFIHYLAKSVTVPETFKRFLFVLMSIQICVLGVVPSYQNYWINDPTFGRFISFIGYASLVQAPPVETSSFLPLLITCYTLFLLEEILFNIFLFYYMRKRNLNKYICYLVHYFSIIISNILFPFIVSITGRYLSFSFQTTLKQSTSYRFRDPNSGFDINFLKHLFDVNLEETDEVTPKSGLAILSFVIFIYAFAKSIISNIFYNSTISFNETLFLTRLPYVPVRIMVSIGIIAFLSPIFPDFEGETPALAGLILFVSFINLIIELVSFNWTIKWQFILLNSTLFSAVLTSLLLLIDICFTSWNNSKLFLWVPLGALLISWVFLPLYHSFLVKKTFQKLSDHDYPSKVKSIFYVLRDFSIGFIYSHPAILNSIYVEQILKRFPDSFDFYLFLANFSLTCNTCPLSMEEIAQKIIPTQSFSPVKKHVFLSITKVMAPNNELEVENFNKLVISVKKNIFRLLTANKQILDTILDELTTTLPSSVLSFNVTYHKAIYRLSQFVQRYPGSPEGDYFISIFENIFPNSKELNKLKRWHNYLPNYVKMFTSIYPMRIKSRILQPEIFSPYHPHYIQNSLPLPEPLEKDLENENEKKRSVKGPFEHAVKKFYFLVLVALTFIIPLSLTPILIAQNSYSRERVDHMTFFWSLLWKLERTNAYLYSTVFFNQSQTLWDQFINISFSDLRDYLVSWIDSVQNDFLHISANYNCSSPINYEVFSELTNFFDLQSSAPFINGNFTIFQGILTTTFLSDEILAVDSVYIQKNDDPLFYITTLRNIEAFYLTVFDDYSNELDKIDIFGHSIVSISPLVIMIICIVMILFNFIFTSIILFQANSRSNLFFMTLRETSKSAIAHVRSYISKQQENIGAIKSQRHKSYQKEGFSFFLHYFLPGLIATIILLFLSVFHFLLHICHRSQLERKNDLYKIFTFSFVNLSRALKFQQEIFFEPFLSSSKFEELSLQIDEIVRYFGQNIDYWKPRQFLFCPLCDMRQLFLTESPTSSTFESNFFDWLSAMSIAIHTNVESDFYEPLQINVSNRFFSFMDVTMYQYLCTMIDLCNNDLDTTFMAGILAFTVHFLVILFFIILLIHVVKFADLPFKQMAELLSILPIKALSKDTIKILTEHSWNYTLDHFEFDPSYYDKVLNILPDAVIVIDRKRNILSYNQNASNIIDVSTNPINKNLFDSLQITLVEASFDSESSDKFDFRNASKGVNLNNENDSERFIPDFRNSLTFQEIVNDYLFDDHTTIPNYQMVSAKKIVNKENQAVSIQYYWYSLTILPIFDESPDQAFTPSFAADNFALIFRDVTEEANQKNLLVEETRKLKLIIYQILPPQIAAKLLVTSRSISDTIDKVAIAFCDIVSFTPWCGSHTAEFVVNALNEMFKVFDEYAAKYSTVTKIKCIGDCYMSAAGIFYKGKDPAKPARQMVHFCLDSIDGIGIVNNSLSTTLQVRIGIAYGGPVSVGVLGINKPVFDIWGETVNEAQLMESSGRPMMVHINKALYEVVFDEPLIFIPKGDQTWLLKRYNMSDELI